MTTHDLRKCALHMFQMAVEAADPARAVRRALETSGLETCNGRQIIIGFGKAAGAMVTEAFTHLSEGADYQALVVTNYENAQPVAGATTMAAGHPIPDENGLRAAQAVMELLNSAGPDDRILALVSGGGSALLPAPAAGLTLTDKAVVNQLLLANGFDITETNLVRQQLSALKGGGFRRLAAPTPLRALIISDVIGDDLRTIASGPTVTPLGTPEKAIELLQTRKIWSELPLSVRTHLSAAKIEQPFNSPVENELICSNRQSLNAAAAAGPKARILSDKLVGDVGQAASQIVEGISNAGGGPTAMIWGGETTVTLTGTGKGGRNQELAARIAKIADDIAGNWVFLSGGTDGRDGTTDAAGGIVDRTTVARAHAKGADFSTLLANNDSYAALAAAGDLLMTGPTGTNVADVQIFLRR